MTANAARPALSWLCVGRVERPRPSKLTERRRKRTPSSAVCAYDGFREGSTHPAALPDGQINRVPDKQLVQPFGKKYFVLSSAKISIIDSAVPPRAEGRIAIVTDVERGMRWTQAACRRMRRLADGEVVWS